MNHLVCNFRLFTLHARYLSVASRHKLGILGNLNVSHPPVWSNMFHCYFLAHLATMLHPLSSTTRNLSSHLSPDSEIRTLFLLSRHRQSHDVWHRRHPNWDRLPKGAGKSLLPHQSVKEWGRGYAILTHCHDNTSALHPGSLPPRRSNPFTPCNKTPLKRKWQIAIRISLIQIDSWRESGGEGQEAPHRERWSDHS